MLLFMTQSFDPCNAAGTGAVLKEDACRAVRCSCEASCKASNTCLLVDLQMRTSLCETSENQPDSTTLCLPIFMMFICFENR